MITNPYHNAAPDRLLELKRQEADALLGLLRSTHTDLSPDQIARIAGFTLKGQLGIGKLCLLLLREEVLERILQIGISVAFDAQQELSGLNNQKPMPVHKERQKGMYEAGIEYILILPGRTGIEGYLLVGDFAQSEAELQNDLIFMQTVAGILGISIENRRLFEEQVSREALRRELSLARSIQERLLPQVFQEVEGIKATARNLPHQQVGGDFYDLIPAEPGIVYICMADVAGKSISAAMIMAVMQASLRVLCRYGGSLEAMMRALHTEFYAVSRGEKFVTLFLGRLDITQKHLTYINAGHNPPLLKSGNDVKELKDGCIPLGIMDIEQMSTGSIRLHAGDTLFLYTDGLTEQENPNEEMYGSERLSEWLSHYEGEDPVADILAIYEAFRQGIAAQDDISLMSVRLE